MTQSDWNNSPYGQRPMSDAEGLGQPPAGGPRGYSGSPGNNSDGPAGYAGPPGQAPQPPGGYAGPGPDSVGPAPHGGFAQYGSPGYGSPGPSPAQYAPGTPTGMPGAPPAGAPGHPGSPSGMPPQGPGYPQGAGPGPGNQPPMDPNAMPPSSFGTGPAQSGKSGWIIGIAAGAVLLIAAVVGVVYFTSQAGDTPPGGPSGPGREQDPAPGDPVPWEVSAGGVPLTGTLTVTEYAWMQEIDTFTPDNGAFLCANIVMEVTEGSWLSSPANFYTVNEAGHENSYYSLGREPRMPIEIIEAGQSAEGWVCWDQPQEPVSLTFSHGGQLTPVRVPIPAQ